MLSTGLHIWYTLFILLAFSQGLCMVLEASCKDGGGIIFTLVDNLLGGLLNMVSVNA